jgi:transposase
LDRIKGSFANQLAQCQVNCHAGQALPASLQGRLARECERLAWVEKQFQQLEATLVEQSPEPVQERIANLMQLKLAGPVGATRLVLELFWRDFAERRQVGSCVGLVPQPYDSGGSRVDQAGLYHLRLAMFFLVRGSVLPNDRLHKIIHTPRPPRPYWG